jgi:hypothetical protein
MVNGVSPFAFDGFDRFDDERESVTATAFAEKAIERDRNFPDHFPPMHKHGRQ